MKEKIKIFHIVDSGGAYGIERMILSLLPKLNTLNCDVSLIFINKIMDGKTVMKDQLAKSGIKVFYPDFEDRYGFKIILYLIKLIWKYKPAIIHCHGYKATILAGIVSSVLNIKCLSTYHAEAKFTPRLNKYVKIETIILKRISKIVAVSEAIKTELISRSISSQRILCIPNGIEDIFQQQPDPVMIKKKDMGFPNLLFAGRLIEKKNVHIIIDVLGKLKTSYPAIRLFIAGDGPYKARLIEQISDLDLTDSVHFLGYVNEIEMLYNFCDIFLLPSQTEGSPISLLEAMSCGKPVVVSAVGSIPSIVTHEENALLVKPGNVKSLFTELNKLIEDQSLRDKIGHNARQTFLDRHQAGIMADKYYSVYEALSTTS